VVFGKLKEKMGNRKTYCVSLFLFFLAMMMMPWIGHRESSPPFEIGNGTVWLWVELGFVLLVKTIAAGKCLTSLVERSLQDMLQESFYPSCFETSEKGANTVIA
jgi:predicted MFS family arabinose efflux permease